jgi:phosphatidylserine/phosphatidylglycerophosphate/cardiolipin synthase-like enzyme
MSTDAQKLAFYQKHRLQMHATPGLEAVVLHWTIGEAFLPGLEGFTIFRTDPGGTRAALRSFAWEKTSELDPIHRFSWIDFNCAEGQTYTYEILARYKTNKTFKVSEYKEFPDASPYLQAKAIVTTHSNANHTVSAHFTKAIDTGIPNWDPTNGIDRRFTEFIATAPDGGSISAHFYQCNRPNIRDAFLQAAGRGVKIRFITDSEYYSKKVSWVPKPRKLKDKVRPELWEDFANQMQLPALPLPGDLPTTHLELQQLVDSLSKKDLQTVAGAVLLPAFQADADALDDLRGYRAELLAFLINRAKYYDVFYKPLEEHPNVRMESDRSAGFSGAWQSHNKFAVICDPVGSPLSVAMGSYNLTDNATERQNNALLLIRAPEVAQVYLEQFNQLWGSDGFEFNRDKSQLRGRGGKKFWEVYTDLSRTVLVPARFPGEAPMVVEVLFSPSPPEPAINDPAKEVTHDTNRVVDFVQRARNSIHFAAFYFTDDAVGGAVRKRMDEGVILSGISDNEGAGSQFSEYHFTMWHKGEVLEGSLNPGLVPFHITDVRVNADYVVHHKFFVLDAGAEGAAVITGSRNFTDAAGRDNDENMLILQDQRLADIFFVEFYQLFSFYKTRYEKTQMWFMKYLSGPDKTFREMFFNPNFKPAG